MELLETWLNLKVYKACVVGESFLASSRQRRAIRPVVLPTEKGEQAQLYRNSHALLNSF